MRATFGIPLLLVLTAIAGCVEPAEPSETSETPTRATTRSTAATNSTDDANATNTTSMMANTPPTANLSHDLDNDSVAINTTFNFTVEGEDADGDNLTWE